MVLRSAATNQYGVIGFISPRKSNASASFAVVEPVLSGKQILNPWRSKSASRGRPDPFALVPRDDRARFYAPHSFNHPSHSRRMSTLRFPWRAGGPSEALHRWVIDGERRALSDALPITHRFPPLSTSAVPILSSNSTPPPSLSNTFSSSPILSPVIGSWY